jgi:hypothetical protein
MPSLTVPQVVPVRMERCRVCLHARLLMRLTLAYILDAHQGVSQLSADSR